MKRFLEEGNKARITIMFRGREITHRDRGQSILEDVVKDVKDIGVVEQAPRMEGRQMFMILAPSPKISQRVRDQARLAAQQAMEKHKGDKPPEKSDKPEEKSASAGEQAAPQPPAEKKDAAPQQAASGGPK